MYKNVKPMVPLLTAWEFIPRAAVNHQAQWRKELVHLEKLAASRHWRFNLDLLEHSLKDQNKAIVVTDTEQVIVYASEYFHKMTGYTVKEAIGRKPDFLQGPATDANTRHEIRQAIRAQKKVGASLINYRKSGEMYECAIEIFPVFNHARELVNFLAVEQEVA